MKIVYPKIDFGLQSKLHPRHQDLKADFVTWMVKEYNIEDVESLEKYAKTAMYWSRAYPSVEYSERLLLVNRLTALWFLIDDVQEGGKVLKESSNSITDELLASIRNPEYQPGNTYVAANAKVMAAIKSSSPPTWFLRFQQNAYQLWYYNSLAATHNDENVLFTNADFVRCISAGIVPCFVLNEFLEDAYLSLRVVLSSYFSNLQRLAVRIIAFYNDIVSFEKEMCQNSLHSTIEVLRRMHGGNYQAAVDAMAGIIRDDMSAFRTQAAHCVNLFNEEDAKNFQLYIDLMLMGIQVNKDFSEDTDRYPRGKDVCFETVRNQFNDQSCKLNDTMSLKCSDTRI